VDNTAGDADVIAMRARATGEVKMGIGDSSRAVRLNVVLRLDALLRRCSEGMTMNIHRVSLVRESVGLLRQVRSALTNDSSHGLVVSINEVIVNLESYLHEGHDDPGRLAEILKVLAQGLGAIPAIQQIIEFSSKQ
jgi:hypothetical protein